jgi:mycothiol synthase
VRANLVPGGVEAPRTELLARVENLGGLDSDELRRVSLLVERATEADGVRPLSEETNLSLAADATQGIRHLLVYLPHASPGGGRLAGYGRLDPQGSVDGSRAELIVDPDLRSRGAGRLLVRHLIAGAPSDGLSLWAHGDLAPARVFAHRLGFTDCRRLHQLLRSPMQSSPAGVSEETRYVDPDDEAALRLSERLGFTKWQTVACYRREPTD